MQSEHAHEASYLHVGFAKEVVLVGTNVKHLLEPGVTLGQQLEVLVRFRMDAQASLDLAARAGRGRVVSALQIAR